MSKIQKVEDRDVYLVGINVKKSRRYLVERGPMVQGIDAKLGKHGSFMTQLWNDFPSFADIGNN